MVDELRSRIMRANRGRDTKPEVKLRRALHARGFRYRIGVGRLPGSPDLVFPKWNAVVFVHGCYWHHHEGCRRATIPKTNQSFWKGKFTANRERDARNVRHLSDAGWRVGVVWECARHIEEEVTKFLLGDERYCEWQSPDFNGAVGASA